MRYVRQMERIIGQYFEYPNKIILLIGNSFFVPGAPPFFESRHQQFQ